MDETAACARMRLAGAWKISWAGEEEMGVKCEEEMRLERR